MERISARKERGFYSAVGRQKNLGTGPTLIISVAELQRELTTKPRERGCSKVRMLFRQRHNGLGCGTSKSSISSSPESSEPYCGPLFPVKCRGSATFMARRERSTEDEKTVWLPSAQQPLLVHMSGV